MEVRIYCVSFEIMHKDKRFLKSAIKHLERGFMKEDVANGLYSISRQGRGSRAAGRGGGARTAYYQKSVMLSLFLKHRPISRPDVIRRARLI